SRVPTEYRIRPGGTEMTPNRTVTAAVVTVSAAALVLVGCSSDDGGGASSGEPIEGGTFTQILSADPGNLDPQMSAGSALFDVTTFAYDTLVAVDAEGHPQ